MKALFRTILILLISISAFGQSNAQGNYDFDETKYKFDSPDKLIKSLIKTLNNYNEKEILEHCIPKDAIPYFFKQASKVSGDQNIDEAIKAIQEVFDSLQMQYIIATTNLKWSIDHDTVKLSKAKIDKIDYKVVDWNGLQPNVMFTAVTITLNYNKKQYTMKLPKMIRLKNKWFIVDPDFWWQEMSMPFDRIIE